MNSDSLLYLITGFTLVNSFLCLLLPFLLSKRLLQLREDIEMTARNPMAAKKEFIKRRREGRLKRKREKPVPTFFLQSSTYILKTIQLKFLPQTKMRLTLFYHCWL